VDRGGYVRFYDTAFVLFVSGIDGDDDTELIFLHREIGTFLLNDVSENLMFEKTTSPFLENSFTVSPSSRTS
jgi:hypothetical protein